MATDAQPAQIIMDNYDIKDLPPDQQLLLDPARPLPPQVAFFPEEQRWAAVLLALGGGAVCLLLGFCALVGAIFSVVNNDGANTTVYGTNSPFGCFVGATLLLGGAGVVILLTARNRVRALRAQGRGQVARIGLFLSPVGLLQREPFTYRYIARGRIQGVRLEGNAPKLDFLNKENAPQTIALPERLVGMTGPQTAQAVASWLQQTARP